MTFKMKGFSAFTTDYKQKLQNLAKQAKEAKNEEEGIRIQNEIKNLQNKMNKERAGGEMKAYPVVPRIASKIKK
tara:strand:+ start:45 stop:266 length:222 start_codon:yes stop_codon:yes gene_type:complete